MSLLVGCPVILPPRDDVLASWTHRPHLLVINGESAAWSAEARSRYGTRREYRTVSNREHVGLCPCADAGDSGGICAGTAKNIGVAASWNQVFRSAQDLNVSHVALISQGTVLEGGTARLADLVDEYADERGLLTDFAWHCIVLSVKTWEQLGPFDEGFGYAYYEDSDYVRRLFLAGLHTPDNRMPKVERDLLTGTETVAAAKHLIPADTYGKNGLRFREKWGGDPFKETYRRPFDASYADDYNWSTRDVDHLGQPR